MANWLFKINLKDEWKKFDNGELSVQQVAKVVADKLSLIGIYIKEIDEKRKDLIYEFNCLAECPDTTLEEFNYLMDDLYDWADTSLDSEFNGKKVCWIETF